MALEAALYDRAERPRVEQPLVPAIDNIPLCVLQLAFSSFHLLGRQLLRGSSIQLSRISQAEIDDDGVTLDVLQEDVAWLDVPMSDASIVHVV